MPAVGVDQPTPVVPERRRRQSPEIIDVDLLDDDDILQVTGHSPQRRRLTDGASSVSAGRDSILVLDSDEERDIQFIGSNFSPPRMRSNNRSRIFSPPPHIQPDVIPPVPPVPPQFVPMRRRPPPFPRNPTDTSGVVLPNEHPFPFEASFRPAARRRENPSAPIPPPAAARPSHHVPPMGFGGALLAMTRHALGNGSRSNDDDGMARRRRFLYPPTAVGMFRRWGGFDYNPDAVADFEDEAFAFLADDDPDRPFYHYTGGSLAAKPVEPDYKPEFTHPDKPPPGFTFDFAPQSSAPSTPPSNSRSVIVVDDSPGPSSASSSLSEEAGVTLACAHCRDPLILGGADVAEGRSGRKLWGLRCGHLLDGKCVDGIMKPAIPDPPPEFDLKPDVKGKGKANAEASYWGPLFSNPVTPSKGKGKAVENENQDRDVATDTHISPSHPQPPDGSIRSRLRPRHPHSPNAMHSTVSYDFPASPSPNRISGRSGPRRRGPANASPSGFGSLRYRGKGKGKGKAKGPTIEAEHEWRCPVSGCEQIHVSLLIDGKWTADKTRGAIAVFV
ncbi:hypothetical protein SERLA73DRAFT_182075 [Serpula lacrymans var. lacrymans S7.3]|uniref:Uncharacterized protein n=2 Tax=Serpula lacrymans var. lacrymans TaxID=341189 RepID=F8PZ83_SERL3|nr:uncharacterized protein SERLADRAFT_468557 [Serpula lacrymans var. lacrymans S7.9]EGN99196.1 hypothetical protein SERLA73DRAFT_182075 [Serpula lacrymans var. lacrymans S7.3]EGO24764.1 hypothetical protein SERLADRAFT_468557 [Serpula lacrymans var. lacrymans S7.9]